MKRIDFLEVFMGEMHERLVKGEEKYGDIWMIQDLFTELEVELVDAANYAYLLWLRLRLIREALRRGARCDS